MANKKIYHAIKNKEGLYFAGWDTENRKDIFEKTYYFLFDFEVAKKRISNMSNRSELSIVVSPVQDSSIWEETNPYKNTKK